MGIVGGTLKVYIPVFGIDSAIEKSKFSFPSKESRISTAWQFTLSGSSVLATFQVTVSSEPTTQTVESSCDVTRKGPAVPATKN